MEPGNAEERNKINEWLIDRQREEFRREGETGRLAKHRELDSNESRLRGEIRRQQDLLSAAEREDQQEFREASGRLEAARRCDQRGRNGKQ